MAPRNWDGGKPVAARGRYRVACLVNVTTPLTEGAAGSLGSVGDEIDWIWLFPATTTPGSSWLLDGATVVWLWPAGIALSDIRPIFVPLNLRSLSAGWSIVTGLNMTALSAGAFS